MNDATLSRREMMTAAGGLLAVGTMSNSATAGPKNGRKSPFGYCLNMSTLRGQKLTIEQQIQVAAEAGYDAIEPWMRDLETYISSGKSLKDLRKRITDAGLTVESAIGFAQWIVDDDTQRAKGLEAAKHDMDILQQIGGKRIAAPPVGATKQKDLNLFRAAERYRTLLELGVKMNVIPQVEVWGFSSSLSRLGESVFVMIEAGHPQACLLPDVYHIYKGGSEFGGLKKLSASAIQVFHINDYPADPPRDTIGDADRVYPGDGVAPLDSILQTLYLNGSTCMLSLELFNRTYWEQDALVVAKTGLAKSKAAVKKALDGLPQ